MLPSGGELSLFELSPFFSNYVATFWKRRVLQPLVGQLCNILA